MGERNYYTIYFEKLAVFSQNASPEEILLKVKEIEEVLSKRIELDKQLADPNRLEDGFGTPESVVETKPNINNPVDLEPFGTPDEPKSIGGM